MMRFAQVYSRTQVGIEAISVAVEVHLSNGIPKMNIVGLPDKAVKESRDRVRSALMTSQFDCPARYITISLAPADLPKDGGRFDLPIAIGILVASGQLKVEQLLDYEFIGELALDGSLRPVSAVLPTVISCKKAKRRLILPRANAAEAALIPDAEFYVADHLVEVCQVLSGQKPWQNYRGQSIQASGDSVEYDFSEVKGQQFAKRALEIAAAGGHNSLMSGPPGTGKSMLASRLMSILPKLSEDEALEVASIASISHVPGSTKLNQIAEHFYQRPFRQPHHTASQVALIGGGSDPKPGEISLAHKGVLFLDEIPQFSRHVLEVLREPLEEGKVSIARAQRQAQYPAEFQLVAAMNPCPCGFSGSKKQSCCCSATEIERYQQKLSGPLLDRIDLHINVPEVDIEVLMSDAPSEGSKQIQARVIKARQFQLQRQACVNARLDQKGLKKHCQLEQADQQWLMKVAQKMNLSGRGLHRSLKLARTIADLTQEKQISRQHLSEAIGYRCKHGPGANALR